MNIIKNIYSFVDDKKLRVNYYSDSIHIINYLEIKELFHEKINLSYQDGNVIVKGKNLSISKMVKDELLIKGEVKEISFEVNHEL